MAQLAIDKGVKVSQDGTVYSEFLAQVRSQTKVWQAVHDIVETRFDIRSKDANWL